MDIGDALSQPKMVRETTIRLMDCILENSYAKGLDCADLSTAMPRGGDGWIGEFAALNEALARYPSNPESFRVEQAEISARDTYELRTPSEGSIRCTRRSRRRASGWTPTRLPSLSPSPNCWPCASAA